VGSDTAARGTPNAYAAPCCTAAANAALTASFADTPAMVWLTATVVTVATDGEPTDGDLVEAMRERLSARGWDQRGVLPVAACGGRVPQTQADGNIAMVGGEYARAVLAQLRR
jgi:hypothetical protein